MPDHAITVRAADTFRGVVLLADCSCGVHIKSDDRAAVTLAELNEIAHEHIEAAERDTPGDWALTGGISRPRQQEPEGNLSHSKEVALSDDMLPSVTRGGYVHGLDPAAEDPRNHILET